MYQEGPIDILCCREKSTRGARDEHEHDQQGRDDRGGAVIRIGSVASHDARADAGCPPLPRPRVSVDQGTTVSPPAA